MKKTIVLLGLLISINSYCQRKDDTTQKKDTVSKVDTLYYIILKKPEFENLISIIQQLDEKPSIIKAWLQENIFKKTQLVVPPKEKAKK